MTALRTLRSLAGVALVIGFLTLELGGQAGAASRPAAPRPLAPGPTAAHPYQGMRRLTIATIPPVPGVRFAIDGQELVADASGVATTLVTTDQRLAVRNARDQHLTVVTPTVEPEPGVRAHFAGWSGKGKYRSGGPVPEEYLRATFNIDYLTSFQFTAPSGALVKPKSLHTMSLRSSTGARILLRRFAPVWLSGSLAATGHNGLQVRAISYAIDDVTTKGASVVHRAQQRFFPSGRRIVTVPLLLFDIKFVAGDAFFGGAVGSAITLEFPDGTARRIPLDSAGTATVRRLPRGAYHATVTGAGPRTSQQLTISKAAQLDLQVLSWLDTALLVGLMLAVLLALLLAGRSVRRRSRGRGDPDLVEVERTERPEPEMVGAS